MAKKELVENIVKLYSKLGGNIGDVLGSRSNVTFLGTGKNPEPFIDLDINMEAVGVLGKSKILDELKSPMGYLTANKLNDIQATKLYNNMLKLEDFYYPKQVSNIADLGTGTRNLNQEGLAALRSKLRNRENTDLTDSPLDDLKNIVDDFRPMGDDLPPPGSRGGPDDIAAPFASADETIANLQKQDPELAAQFKALMTNKGDVPAKRSSAREFLVEALKKDEYDVGTAAFGKVNLNNVISAEDVKYITEGGGGIGGDPIVLVEKYFGPRIAELLPAGATGDEIVRFTNRVLTSVEDAAGLKPDNPKFDKMTARFIDEMAEGGRARFAGGGKDAGAGSNFGNENFGTQEGGGNDASKVDFGPPSNTGGDGGNKTKFVNIDVKPDYNTIANVPRYFDISKAVKGGLLNLRTDIFDTVKDEDLDSELSYTGAIGPIDVNAMADLKGNKALNLDYNKGNFNVGAATDFDGNTNYTLNYNKSFEDGGLARQGLRFGKSAGKAFGLAKKLANINKSVDEGTQMGYGALREYGLEAEDITRLFKDLAMDKSMVGAEKTEYFKLLNQVLKNPDDFPKEIIEIKKRLGLDYADGGRAGYRFGKSVFKGIADIFKKGADDVDLVKQEETFRTGPITEKFLGDVDKKVIDKFIRTRDTSGPGSYGMYDSLAEMPQGLQAAEFIKNVRVPGKNTIDYERAEMYIGGGIKLTGKETIDELLQMFLNAVKQPLARGGLAKILEV